ncbi:hypothetical protein [Ruania rhizosphaerae]|uniref:hypothetical protein n=1 Tax=Ruania rhizosphaerae TaxID=1840413 RepID=UPI0013575DC0|nr:hypothetical protein [Ruania rhizosphaerae]
MTFDSTNLHIGAEWQLFLDDQLIEQADGACRRWHQPERVGDPVIVADQPWEQHPYFTYSNYNVLRDPHDGLVKCWYEDLGPMHPYQTHPWKTRLLYAESEDGVTFTKPLFDHVRVDGSRTNIVAGYNGETPTLGNQWSQLGVHSSAIAISSPAASGHPYNMLFTEMDGQSSRTSCAFSEDGLHWLRAGEIPSIGRSGSALGDVSTIRFDQRTGLFTQYTRHPAMMNVGYSPASHPPAAGKGGFARPFFPHRTDLENRRRIYRSVSADFINWSELVPVLSPTSVFENFDVGYYGMPAWEAGNYTVGTLGVLHYVDNVMEVRLAYSHQEQDWQLAHGGTPFLEARSAENWDSRLVSIVSPPVQFGDKWFFYHGGAPNSHDFWMSGRQRLDHPEARDPSSHVSFGLGRAEMRVNGLCSIDARSPRAGQVISRPLRLPGRKLTINARCRDGGGLRVAVLHEDGEPLPGRRFENCDPWAGDSVEWRPHWNGDSNIVPEGMEAGKRVKLAFELNDAELFAFQSHDQS